MSDVDTRRLTAEGTNYVDSGAPIDDDNLIKTHFTDKKKGGSGGGGFTMDPSSEKSLLEEFRKANNIPSSSASSSSSSTPEKVSTKEGAGIRFNTFRPDMTIDNEREKEIQTFISERQTWRAGVPMMRWFEYWRLRADFYPYIKQSDSQENFFLRGITCHPRLSEFPTCKEVIRDYFMCRDEAKILAVMNPCAPMKEQLSACINMVFLRNHSRGDKKFNNGAREEKYEKTREAKFNRLLESADSSIKEKTSFRD